MPIKSRKVTPRMAKANRGNSQKSTGPRTPEGKQQVRYNAVKHGLYGQPSPELMLALGEDPLVYEQLREDHRQSFFPFTPVQNMLCDELALLRWERMRNQRAQTAQINCQHEELDINSEEAAQRYDHDGMCFNRAEVVEKGMINMPDCPAKFEQMIISLKVLLERVENKEFEEDATQTLVLLYGQQPSLRANAIRHRFQTFLTQKPDKTDYQLLRDDLIQEQMQWNLQYQFYLRRKVEISPAKRNRCFAPTEKVWPLLMRQEAYVDRQLERKTRLLWAMQEEDLRRRRDPEWQAIMQQQGSGAGDQGSGTVEEVPKGVADPTPSEISEQSRQVGETKGSGSNEEQGSGARDQGSGRFQIQDSRFRIEEQAGEQGSLTPRPLGAVGPGGEESTSDPLGGADPVD